MMDFIKGSIRDFKHIVWPTREETKNYFFIVLIALILFGIYLLIVGSVFSEILLFLKNNLF